MLKRGKCVLAENLQFVPTKRQQERGACTADAINKVATPLIKLLVNRKCFAIHAQTLLIAPSTRTPNVTACMKTNGRREAEKEQTAKALLQ